MNIKKVTGQKKEYLDLLLLADEQESMIDRYLERGEMFVLEYNGVKAECVVTKESDGVYELKNIAVKPESQRKGYGKRLVEFVLRIILTATRCLSERAIVRHLFPFIEAVALPNRIG